MVTLEYDFRFEFEKKGFDHRYCPPIGVNCQDAGLKINNILLPASSLK
jgi:hypothetical protein